MLNLSIGEKVGLNNGWAGEIFFIEELEPTRPIIRMDNEEIIKLINYPELFIDQIIQEDKDMDTERKISK